MKAYIVAIFTQTVSLKPTTSVIEIGTNFISILTLKSYGPLIYGDSLVKLPRLLNYLLGVNFLIVTPTGFRLVPRKVGYKM